MSTELDIFQQAGSAVTISTNRRDDGFTNLVSASTQTSKRISIRGGLFRLMVNGKEIEHTDQRHLDVVIVNVSPSVHRTFYAANYNATQKAPPPVCWSSDSTVPDSSVPEPQSKSCIDCPQNIKGSGPNGSKACRFSRRIAVVRATQDQNKIWYIDDEVFQITLPSQSIFGAGTTDKRPLHEYAEYVKANNETLMSVVTRMAFDTSSATPRLGFRAMGYLTDEQFDHCKQISQSEESKRAITLTVMTNKEDDNGFSQSAVPPKNPAPAPQAAPVQTQPAQAQVATVQVQTAPAEAIPEPTVRSAAPPVSQPPAQPAPAPKLDDTEMSLDDITDDWA